MDNWWQSIGLGSLAAAWTANLARGAKRGERLLLAPRIVYSVGRELAFGHLNLSAGSLVYTTLLSLVPLLAVSFALLKGFGVHERVEPLLFELLTPLGSNGVEIGERVMGFVNNAQAGVLGSVGLLVLMYTIISLLQKIEAAFNYAWRVGKARPLHQRASHYLAAVLVGPVLVLTAIGITASVLGSEVFRGIEAQDPSGLLRPVVGKAVSYLLVIAAFTFLYVYIPNARVRLRSALVGALVAGVLWEAAGWAFGAFVVGSTRYTAIYSGFAVLVVFMLWLYAAWLVLLMGASVAFYHQHRECLGLLPNEVRLSNRTRERVALSVAQLVAVSHLHGTRPWTAWALSRRIGVPLAPLLPLLEAMAARGVLLAPTDEEGPWVPARDLAELRVLDVMAAAREAYETAHLGLDRMQFTESVEALASGIEEVAADVVRDVTLREWAQRCAASLAQTENVDAVPPAADTAVAEGRAPEEALAMPANAVSLNEHKRGGGSSR